MDKYKEYFQKVINSMDRDFLWTIEIDKEQLAQLIKNEIKPNHLLYKKEIIPIAVCKNKFDVLAYYVENNKDIIIAIHFKGHKSINELDPDFDIFDSIDAACKRIKEVYFGLYKNSRYTLMIDGENNKRTKSNLLLNGLYIILPEIYDTLWKINEFRGEYAKEDDIQLIKIQDLFQFFLAEFPYKIRDIFLLAEIGNYSDSCILLRSLVETFIYFKYYIIKNDGDGLSQYVARESKKRIIDIMEKVVPGYYNNEYAQLCKFTHGNPMILGLFRGNVNKSQPFKYDINGINLDWYSYIINLTFPIIVGMFNMFEIVYSKNTIKTFKPLEEKVKYLKKFVLNDMNERYKKYPQQRDTIDRYRKIIEFND